VGIRAEALYPIIVGAAAGNSEAIGTMSVDTALVRCDGLATHAIAALAVA